MCMSVVSGDDGSGVRVPLFSVGERVKIDDNLERVKNLAENHGGWHHSMQQVRFFIVFHIIFFVLFFIKCLF